MTMPTITGTAPPTMPTTDTTKDRPASEMSSSNTSRVLMRGSFMIPVAPPSRDDTKSWYEAMAKAWGQALNQQAQVLTNLSEQIGVAGNDQPSQVTQLTAESMRFSYLATNASTSTTSVGEALQTLGRKQ